MKYEYLLFDADDTLLDFQLAEKNAFYDLLEEKGIESSPFLHENYSKINRNIWERFEKGLIKKESIGYTRYFEFLNKFNIDGDANDFNRTYHRLLGLHGETFPESDEVCAELCRRGHKIYIITNGYADTQKSRFAFSGLNKYISAMFVSETFGVQKPEKEFFEQVFLSVGCHDKNKYLIIGDSLSSDILGGMNIGVDTCWFNSRKCEKSSVIMPTYTIERLSDILSILY